MTPTVAAVFDPMVWVIIFAIVVLLFGASRLPALGKSVGQGIHGFKTGLNEDDDADKPKELENKPSDGAKPPVA
jgi:sec-independent protein translocase protein TatA